MRIDLTKLSFNSLDAITSFISFLPFKKVKFSNVSMQIIMEGPMERDEAIKLIDKLPASLYNGTIKASIEVKEVA